jgi:hypothetical protein
MGHQEATAPLPKGTTTTITEVVIIKMCMVLQFQGEMTVLVGISIIMAHPGETRPITLAAAHPGEIVEALQTNQYSKNHLSLPRKNPTWR